MFTFVHNPKRESLREFNSRVREFCSDKPVISIEAVTFGSNLIMQGTLADDVDIPDGTPTLTAGVRSIDQESMDLEEQLDGLIAQELEKDKSDEDGDPNVPVRFIIAAGEKKSWVVLLCINGVVEDDLPGGPDDGDIPSDSPAPASPAAGFPS